MIALYPGAFKPPHRGHFNVVKSLLDGSYNGTVYSKDNYKEKASSLFSGNNESKPKIEKVVIFVGGGERNGIDKQEATSIWEIYAKHLGNVEIVDGQKNPMFAAKDYARENPNEEFVAVTGIRGEEDFVDLKRVTTFNNVDNVEGLALASKPGSGVRATDFRKSILAGNLDQVIDFFPKELSREEILNILTDLKDKIVAEVIGSHVSNFLDEYFASKSNLDYKPQKINKSVDRNRLGNLYNYLNRLIPTGTNIKLTDDSIIVKYDDPLTEQKRGPELKEYIGSLLEYMLDEGMNITPLPEVKIRKDSAEAANFFGRTAYYDPNNKEIVLYVTGRHNKDIVRSFSHEMVHHMQNLEGRLNNVKTSDTTADNGLLELEKEAYLVGNITFRNWEDSLKNKNEDRDGKKAFSREIQLSENISKSQLDAIEAYADKLFAKLGIDIEFTKHFLDRANDERNKKPISVAELIGMFKKLHRKHGKPLSKIDNDFDAVVKDFNNDINIPFAIDVTQDGIDMYAKTIMRKKDFKTSTPVYPLQEGRYDKIANQLSRIAFEFFKDVHDRGDKEGEFEFRVGNPEYDDVDIESTQFEFDFMGVVKYTDDTYKVDGGANAGFDDDGEEIQPMINVKFMIPRNPDWQEVSMDLKDVVRHELEHLTQDGENLRPGKYIPDDQALRMFIDKGLLDKDAYYTLPKEIDAMIQGLYFKAKKSKKPFSDVVDDYLKKVVDKLETRKKIRILWNKRLPALGIKQRL